jgi:hypothetical protein
VHAALAQSVEHLTRNEKVVSSILTGGSIGKKLTTSIFLPCLRIIDLLMDEFPSPFRSR